MSQDFCRGCGSLLQSLDSKAAGYIPESVLLKRKQLICQRCFRITHYGEAGAVQPGKTQIRNQLNKAIQISQLLIVVADFSDLTGTLPVWADYLNDKPYLLVLNKCDLLPAQTNVDEVKSYLDDYLKGFNMAAPQKILLVSALNGNGFNLLGGEIKRAARADAKIALLGVTNVGKSSLVKQFLRAEGSQHTPTVSKVPGTTMGLSNWSIFQGRNTLIDTPGLVPEDRVGDLLCPECSRRLVANAKLTRKLWGIKPGKGLIVGGLFAVESLEDAEIVLLAFTSGEMISHRTDSSKITSILESNPDWLKGVCTSCFSNIEWQEQVVNMEAGMDLAVAGLGWISLRKAPARLKIFLPKQVRWEYRAGLIGKKTME